jgi:hypothetical protein
MSIVVFFVFNLDGTIHPQYAQYGQEYYPLPGYPMYPPEQQFDLQHDDYFNSQIHVRSSNVRF